jgi:hypothetical protein
LDSGAAECAPVRELMKERVDWPALLPGIAVFQRLPKCVRKVGSCASVGHLGEVTRRWDSSRVGVVRG